MRWRDDPDLQSRFCGVELPGSLHRRMKLEAIERGTTMKALLLEACQIVYGAEMRQSDGNNEIKK